jgi:DNA-binding MarR family transcriptional regulator
MFKTASVLSHVDSKLTAGEMAELLEGTKWEIDQSQLSNLMGALYRDAVAERSKRPVERQGDSPYEYWLNEEGQAAYAEAHAEAQRHDIDTFSDITSSESESDSDEEPTESSAEGISLTQGSTLYRTVSLLSLTDGLTTREIEEKLEETDWETDYETLTDALETLFEHELVERERRSAPGRPYAYSLSESGRRLASEKLLDSDTSDAGALADVFIEQTSEDAETESGLDELFKRETDEGEELALFTDTGATPPSE